MTHLSDYVQYLYYYSSIQSIYHCLDFRVSRRVFDLASTRMRTMPLYHYYCLLLEGPFVEL